MAVIVTMLLVIASGTGIFAATDSMRSPDNYITQKIFPVGKDGIIMNGGFALIPGAGEDGGDWDATTEFRKIAASLADLPPNEAFAELRDRVNGSFSAAVTRYRGTLPADKSLDFFFAMRRNGRNYIWLQKIALTSTHPVETVLIQPTSFESGVYWDLPPECEMQHFDFSTDVSAAVISDLFSRVSKQSESCSREIGGPFRIAHIDERGLTWLQDQPPE